MGNSRDIDLKMRFILLLGAVFGAPTIRNYNIKTMMNGNGSGSIDVTAGDDTWQYEWPELNESVKTTINSKLDEMGIEGGLDENNQFNFKISGSSINQVSKTRKSKP